MRRLLAIPVLSAALAWCACASHTQIPADERASIERELTSGYPQKYLKLSYYVTPFFGDGTKKLLTPVPPDEVRLLNNPDGTPVNPGPVEKVLPAGKRARVLKVEFPTSWVVTERVPYTPRTQPWVYLSVEGEPNTFPLILVLRQGIKTRDDFLNELGRYLSDQDPMPTIRTWSDAIQQAIETKSAVTDMPTEALEMAWGYPEHIKVELEGDKRLETWVYPGRKRIAHIVDGRLVRTETK
ncbi:MAG: hypothetical protein IRZ16_10120 [Myxococcaceae bacterium]|nr:hypothetical protein [Myxococcaceae bacterium]